MLADSNGPEFSAELPSLVPGVFAYALTQAMPAAGEELVIRVAALGEDRLAIGAAELAFERLLADPLQEG